MEIIVLLPVVVQQTTVHMNNHLTHRHLVLMPVVSMLMHHQVLISAVSKRVHHLV
jgi:predicted Na+-dependent transporter